MATSEIDNLNQRIAGLSPAKRALLELRSKKNGQATVEQTITRRAKRDLIPLSFAQQRLWFLNQLEPESFHYNVPRVIRMIGALNVEALHRTLEAIVARHESLRTTFSTVDGSPVQVIAERGCVEMPVIDLSQLPGSEREAEVQRLSIEEGQRPFDLAHGPLLRARLLRVREEEHVLLLTMHHIVSDGWSAGVLFREMAALYEAFSAGKPSPLSELPIQYADYAVWQRDCLQGEVLEEQLSYWKKQLGGALPLLELPADHARVPSQNFLGAMQSLVLSKELTEGLKLLSRREDVTLSMLLLAAFQTLLYRYSNEEDIVVGLPIANRSRAEIEGLIGFFLNTLVMRTDLSGNPTFGELLGRVREVALGAYAHQDMPFEKLVEELQPERSLTRTPLFQVFFNMLNLPARRLGLPGLVVEELPSPDIGSKFDLTLYAREDKLTFAYNADLFDATTIIRMLGHLQTLLEGIVINPEQRLSQLPLLTDAERHQLSIRGNSVHPSNSFVEFIREEIEQSIPHRFEQQVKKYPKNVAIKSKNYDWTYEELNKAASRVAQQILGLRGSSEERIALLFEHDAPMIAGILGALKSGKTYVPLDPSYPKERLAYILEDSRADVVLTNTINLTLAKKLTKDRLPLINIDEIDSAALVDDIDLAISPNTIAYFLYTSGSTGQPKGVMQNHRSVLHHIRCYTNNLHINADDRLTLLSSYSFDAAVMDIFGALLNGAALYPIPIKEQGLTEIREWLIEQEITIYHSTPTVYRYFVSGLTGENEFPKIRLVVLGGEEVFKKDVDLYKKHFSSECLFINGLGPTESTVSLQYFINKQTEISRNIVPVGYPVDDTEVLLLNRAGEPVTVYGIGEIAIRSAYIALGYWQKAKLTEEAFSRDAEGKSRPMYRTRDLGRLLPDGSIEFIGRRDFQTKIRGYRIELGEIEAALAEHPTVRETVVVAREDEPGEKRLVAYFVGAREISPSISELRSHLQEKLPNYMLPSAFMMLDRIPLTPNGKVDRHALPVPERSGSGSEEAYVAPRNRLELQMTEIWEEVLAVQPIGVKDNFFDLGGHSLLAVRLFQQTEKVFGRNLPLATLFQAPTIEQLADILRQEEWSAPWSSLVALQTGGSKPPFYCIHAIGGNVLFYRDLARRLGPDQPFYALQALGLDGTKQLPNMRIEDMAAEYIKEIRAVQPEGPYCLGGVSFGGRVAYEMARQLRAQGERVALVALFDTHGPGYPKLLPSTTSFQYKVLRLRQRVAHHLETLMILEPKEKLTYFLKKAKKARRITKGGVSKKIKQTTGKLYRLTGQSLPPALEETISYLRVAKQTYIPQVYPGKVTLFRASIQPPGIYPDPTLGWGRLVTGVLEIHEVPGSHGAIVVEPRVRFLADKLRECIDKAMVNENGFRH